MRRQSAILVAYATLLCILVVVLVWMLLIVLDPRGAGAERQEVAGIEPLLVIEGPGKGVTPLFSRPMGVAVGRDGRIYVADAGNNRICVFDRSGDYLFEFGGRGIAKPLPGAMKTWRPGLMNYPVGIDVDDSGDVYVADFRNDQIQVFDSEGEFLRRFPDPEAPVGRGSSGQDGLGIAVTDVSVVGDLVYATDAYQVFVFDRSGRFIRQFGKPGRGDSDLDHPNGVGASEDGIVYVSDSNHSRVIGFDPSGKELWKVGSIRDDIADRSSGDFDLPRGLSVGVSHILVVDALASDLVILDMRGKLVRRYGARGVNPGELNFPNDVCVDGDRVVIADKGNDRVQVVRLTGLEVSLD